MSIELKKANKLKGPSEDTSVPLGREKKATTMGKGGRDRGRKGDAGGGRGKHNKVLGGQKRLMP